MYIHYKYFILLIIVLLIPMVESYNEASYLEIDSGFSNSLYIESQSLTSEFIEGSVNFTWVPLNDYRQEVLSINYQPDGELTNEELYYKFQEPNSFDLNIDSTIRTSSDTIKIREKVDYPIQELPSNKTKYTRHTGLIDSNEEIARLAAELSAGEDDLYQVVFNTNDWVMQNIEYNLSTLAAEADMPSSWVLEEEQGVCAEMTNLFISLLREQGIPARFVTGVAYTESELFDYNWGPHGWAEVYIPNNGWIPIDPTYGQIGFVDASHIAVYKGVDSSIYPTSYSWRADGYDLSMSGLEIDKEVVSVGDSRDNEVNVSLSFEEDEARLGSYNVVRAEVVNEKDYYVARTFSISKIDGLELVSDREQSVLLEPDETGTLEWVVKIDELESGFTYSFPISIYNSIGESSTSLFEAHSNGNPLSREEAFYEGVEKDLFLSCSAEEDVYYLDEDIVFRCESYKEGELCYKNECEDVSKGSDVVFEDSFTDVGYRSISFSLNEQVNYASFEVIDEPNVELNTSYDEFIYGSNNLHFKIDSTSYSTPRNVQVTIGNDLFSKHWSLKSLDSVVEETVVIDKESLIFGSERLVLEVYFEDEIGTSYEKRKIIDFKYEELSLLDNILIGWNTFKGWFVW